MPYPNEHSCRLIEPEKFQKKSFRRITNGDLSIIIGKLIGDTKVTTQAYRYNTKSWTYARAKAHCEKAGGAFHPALKKTAGKEMDGIDETKGINLLANLNGEMATADIPLATGVNLEQLKKGDKDPLEVVVEIDSGYSTRKWNYLPATVKKIVDQINMKTPNGFLGHQKAEDINTEFPDIATHWIGALYKDGKAFVRGYVDPSMTKLKRLIRSNRIKQVSIFGVPTLRSTSKGETQVVDYKLLSLDWTPKDRNGMPTQVVATSEMDVYDSVSNISNTNLPGGEVMTTKEIVATVKELLATGEMKRDDLKALIGDAEDSAKLQELAKKFNVKPEQLEGEITRLLGVEETAMTEKHKVLVHDVLKKKVANETVRGLVGEMLHSDVADDEKKIVAEIDAILQKDIVKKMLSELHIDDVAIAPKTKDPNVKQFTEVEKVKI